MKGGRPGGTNAATPNTIAKAPQRAASHQVREMAESIVFSVCEHGVMPVPSGTCGPRWCRNWLSEQIGEQD
jgi:hypothetical protein